MNRLGDGGMHTLSDTSAFVNPAGQLLLPGGGKTRMDTVGIVFEFYWMLRVSNINFESCDALI